MIASSISTHAPAGGATPHENGRPHCRYSFLLTPLREGRPFPITEAASSSYFYSRPCGRGDQSRLPSPCWCRISTHAPAGGATNARGLPYFLLHISTHAPAGGATAVGLNPKKQMLLFLLTPLREGRPLLRHFVVTFCIVFLLTPLREGRHTAGTYPTSGFTFLLTPLREGRRPRPIFLFPRLCISTHAPAGGATRMDAANISSQRIFLLTPLREGRRAASAVAEIRASFLLTPLREGRPVIKANKNPLRNFYSRPCGRGDGLCRRSRGRDFLFLLTPLREGRRQPDHSDSLLTPYFYSRPCGRGDSNFPQVRHEVLRQIAER